MAEAEAKRSEATTKTKTNAKPCPIVRLDDEMYQKIKRELEAMCEGRRIDYGALGSLITRLGLRQDGVSDAEARRVSTQLAQLVLESTRALRGFSATVFDREATFPVFGALMRLIMVSKSFAKCWARNAFLMDALAYLLAYSPKNVVGAQWGFTSPPSLRSAMVWSFAFLVLSASREALKPLFSVPSEMKLLRLEYITNSCSAAAGPCKAANVLMERQIVKDLRSDHKSCVTAALVASNTWLTAGLGENLNRLGLVQVLEEVLARETLTNEQKTMAETALDMAVHSEELMRADDHVSQHFMKLGFATLLEGLQAGTQVCSWRKCTAGLKTDDRRHVVACLGGCQAERYCSDRCLAAHWNDGHEEVCKELRSICAAEGEAK